MLKNKLSILIEKIVKDSFEKEIKIFFQKPRRKKFGDLSINTAMSLASCLKKEVEEISGIIIKKLKSAIKKDKFLGQKIREINFIRPGFINFFLEENSLFETLREIDKQGLNYGHSDLGRGKKINIEFVSANPTGPLNIAHGRQAAIGDSLSNILKDQGYDVRKEYYINDEGTQIDLLGQSTQARYLEFLGKNIPIPANGYQGAYINDIAQIIFEQYKEKGSQKDKNFFAQFSINFILKQIKKDLKDFGVEFNVWFSQKDLSSKRIRKIIEVLKEKKYIFEKKGAIFFKSTSFGDDKDRVLIKSNGEFTYFAPDIAYHQNKYQRGFERLINLWGPDHHGYVSRMKAAIQALGYPTESISILIVQLVTLYRGRKKMAMSTRAGEFVSLRQLIEEIGKDAGRFFFVSRRSDSHLDFDLELAKKKNLQNPVYYIQYAHARICNIIEFAKKSNNFTKVEFDSQGTNFSSLLDKKEEIELIKKLGEFPEVLKLSAKKLEPHHLTIYLQELASIFHSFYNQYRVVNENRKLTSARLLLISCTKTILQKGLNLLGVSAPLRM